jgi:hypothetical protein
MVKMIKIAILKKLTLFRIARIYVNMILIVDHFSSNFILMVQVRKLYRSLTVKLLPAMALWQRRKLGKLTPKQTKWTKKQAYTLLSIKKSQFITATQREISRYQAKLSLNLVKAFFHRKSTSICLISFVITL